MASTRVADDTRRITDRHGERRNVGCDDCSGPDQGVATDGKTRKNDRTGSYRRPVLHETRNHLPVRRPLESSVWVHRTRQTVIREDDVWTYEDAALERDPLEQRSVVLDLAAIADADLRTDVNVLADDAFAPYAGTFTDLSVMPDPRAFSERNVTGYQSCRRYVRLARAAV